MFYLLMVILIVVIEAKIKSYIEETKELGDKEYILGDKIIIHKHHNQGVMLNFLENKKGLVLGLTTASVGIIAILFAIIIPRKNNRLLKLGISIFLAGGISNTYDRYKRGYVIDYFSFNFKKIKRIKNIIFNLADMFIFVGYILILVSRLLSGLLKTK